MTSGLHSTAQLCLDAGRGYGIDDAHIGFDTKIGKPMGVIKSVDKIELPTEFAVECAVTTLSLGKVKHLK